MHRPPVMPGWLQELQQDVQEGTIPNRVLLAATPDALPEPAQDDYVDPPQPEVAAPTEETIIIDMTGSEPEPPLSPPAAPNQGMR